MRVDAHQHFWRYTSAEFDWIDDAMSVIRRDFLPDDLRPLLAEAGIDATVAVQARQSIEETEWLLELAARDAWIAGVVGWVPLAGNAAETLKRFSANEKFRGVRHVLQGEPDAYFDRDDFNAGVALLRGYSLTYDVLIFERQLPAAIRLVDRHPEQAFILDHVAKPRIAAGEIEPWRTRMHELARREHVACKLSGMVTEAHYDRWTADQLRAYFDVAIGAFGAERLMFGSDWPVATVATSYRGWIELVRDWIAELSEPEQAAIMGGNAQRIYGLMSRDEVAIVER